MIRGRSISHKNRTQRKRTALTTEEVQIFVDEVQIFETTSQPQTAQNCLTTTMPPLNRAREQPLGNAMGPPSPKSSSSECCCNSFIISQSAGKSRKRSNPQRKVVFSTKLEYTDTIHVLEYSQEERAAAWYDSNDSKAFRKDRRETALRADTELPLPTDCLRGVEAWTQQGARRRYAHIHTARHAVLEEQELQEWDGQDNPNMLAHIYRIHTMASQAAAYQQGLNDQREVT